jgi:NIMA (never in mitosis gene a)-related kinase
MQYADDGDLFQKIVQKQKKKSLFEEREVWHLLISVVKGLKMLHDLNILH